MSLILFGSPILETRESLTPLWNLLYERFSIKNHFDFFTIENISNIPNEDDKQSVLTFFGNETHVYYNLFDIVEFINEVFFGESCKIGIIFSGDVLHLSFRKIPLHHENLKNYFNELSTTNFYFASELLGIITEHDYPTLYTSPIENIGEKCIVKYTNIVNNHLSIIKNMGEKKQYIFDNYYNFIKSIRVWGMRIDEDNLYYITLEFSNIHLIFECIDNKYVLLLSNDDNDIGIEIGSSFNNVDKFKKELLSLVENYDIDCQIVMLSSLFVILDKII